MEPMRRIKSLNQLEEFGRTRLSQHFFMRDFLYSEIANHYSLPNYPDNPDHAICSGKRLCTELLDPLVNTFGPIFVRSSYRSPQVNGKGNEMGHNCAGNNPNRAGHIWDQLDDEGKIGATACVVVPWFADQYANGRDWRDLAWWLHDHLPYSSICFHPKMAAFNLSWHEAPKKKIYSFIKPMGILRRSNMPSVEGFSKRQKCYADFPGFCGIDYPTNL